MNPVAPIALIATLAVADEPTAEELTAQAFELYGMGDFAGAEALIQQTLERVRAEHGDRHPDVANTLNNLAAIKQSTGDFDGARPLYESSLEILTEALGETHEDVSNALHNLAALHLVEGDFEGARSLFERSIEIQRGSGDDLNLAGSLDHLGMMLYGRGDYSGARPLLEESVALHRTADPKPETLVRAINGLAMILQAQGEYSAARILFEETVAVARAALPSDHPELAVSLNNLGAVLRAIGDYDEARDYLQETLDIERRLAQPRRVRLAAALNNLAVVLQDLGELDGAHTLFEECVDIRRGLHEERPRDADLATTLNNFGMLLQARGEGEIAQGMYEESTALQRATLGSRHPDVSTSLNNHGLVREIHGEYAEAKALFRESLDIRREALGHRHPTISTSLNNLARVHRKQGELDEARVLQDEAMGIAEEHLALLDALSEREALRFVATVRPLLDNWLAMFDRPEDVESAWQHVHHFKGAAAARARATRRQATEEPEVAELAAELDAVRRQRAQLTLSDRSPTDARTEWLAQLSKEQERLERALNTQSAQRGDLSARQATPAVLCDALPDGAVLVDLLRYTVAHEPRYLAFVQSKDCVVHRVDLGPADALEKAAHSWHEVLRDPNSASERVADRGRVLSALLWSPLLEAAGDSDHWLVVPDGPLAAIPFAALPTASGFAIDTHLISYLDRATDVLRDPVGGSGGALVVGGVDYDAVDGEESSVQRSILAPCNGGDFAPLPGTSAEAERLAARWKKSRRRESLTVLRDGSATEGAVSEALEGKRLAHIATHGFFATGDCKSAVDDGVGYDPMVLSGLVLSGANQPARASSTGDGILTASEVATCDLSRTQVVVLSACETGLGEIASGQGVLGLRRAFAIAGAGTLVMSLWAIPDAETVTLMDGLYQRHLRRRAMPAAEALRQAQLEVLARQRATGRVDPFAWAAFISSGDWR